MVRRFQYNIKTTGAAKIRRQYKVGSNQVANEKQLNEWCNNVLEFIMTHDQEAEAGASVHKAVEAFNDACEAACQTLVQAGWVAGTAPAAGNPGIPGMPVGHCTITQTLRNEIWGPYNTQIDVAVAAGGAAVAYIPVGPFRDLQLSEDDFNELNWYILLPMAHSGFTGVGDYKQDVEYQIEGQPEDTILTFKLGLLLGRCLPEGVTPRNLGAAYADFICDTAKEQDIVFRWGVNHGVPDALNHFGFATWSFISKDRMNPDQKRVMQQVTAISLRDKDSFNVNDPGLPDDNIDETQKAMANLTIANKKYVSQHKYRPSSFNPDFQFGSSSKSRED